MFGFPRSWPFRVSGRRCSGHRRGGGLAGAVPASMLGLVSTFLAGLNCRSLLDADLGEAFVGVLQPAASFSPASEDVFIFAFVSGEELQPPAHALFELLVLLF